MKPSFFAPITGSVMPRFAGLATMIRNVNRASGINPFAL